MSSLRSKRVFPPVILLIASWAHAQQKDILGPPGSVSFGTSVTALSNGNFVVTDPTAGTTLANAGAIYLYNSNGLLLNTIVGSSAGDFVGSGGVVVLKNGNYVVASPFWQNAGLQVAGAITWGSAISGTPEGNTVSSANSLVGTHAGDSVGTGGIVVLANGNYVVMSPVWDDGINVDVGAATWGSGDTGVSGPISAANSLVGSLTGDAVGLNGSLALANGNYVVLSPSWNSPLAAVGAATWGDGLHGTLGAVSVANSVIGTSPGDQIGLVGTALANGNYVVGSYYWIDPVSDTPDVGAVSWRRGDIPSPGVISSANSITGDAAFDAVGNNGVVPLSNGNYVVASRDWHGELGAATWGDGAKSTGAVVSDSNSLVGTTQGDQISWEGVAALTNGNYVVVSPLWTNDAGQGVGAVTWGNGQTGSSGAVYTSNSLFGTIGGDSVGEGAVVALTNGNYVVSSPNWQGGFGAATWGNGITGTVGAISNTNSLIGNAPNHHVGTRVFALANDNYVVESPYWDNGSISDVGAITWGNGKTGSVGTVLASNSLVGSNFNDVIGVIGNNTFFAQLTPLANGSYVVPSSFWHNGATVGAGAVTWARGDEGTAGTVSIANSLYGSSPNDHIGAGFAKAFPNNSYVVKSPYWHVSFGSVSLMRGAGPFAGPIDASNSVMGTVAGGGTRMTFDYDVTNDQLIVGQPAANIVSLLRTDLLFRDGFD